MRTLAASIPFVVCLLWLLASGCASAPFRVEQDFACRIVVMDRPQLCALVGRDVDGWTDYETRTIYVTADQGSRPRDWIVGHEVKHLIYGAWHAGTVGTEE